MSDTGDHSNMQGTKNTAPGGENTQYEGARTENLPSAKQSGQLGASETLTKSVSAFSQSSESQPPSQDRAQKTTENIRYGQNISESGMGGMTNTTTGQVSQSGFGGNVQSDQSQDSKQMGTSDSRRAQGYGPGNDVGA